MLYTSLGALAGTGFVLFGRWIWKYPWKFYPRETLWLPAEQGHCLHGKGIRVPAHAYWLVHRIADNQRTHLSWNARYVCHVGNCSVYDLASSTYANAHARKKSLLKNALRRPLLSSESYQLAAGALTGVWGRSMLFLRKEAVS